MVVLGFAVIRWIPDTVVHGDIFFMVDLPQCVNDAYTLGDVMLRTGILPVHELGFTTPAFVDDHVVKDEDAGFTGDFMLSGSPQIFWLHFLVTQPSRDTVVGQCK